MSGHDFANPHPLKAQCPQKAEKKKADGCSTSSAEPRKCRKTYNPSNPCEKRQKGEKSDKSDKSKKKCEKPDPCHKYSNKK